MDGNACTNAFYITKCEYRLKLYPKNQTFYEEGTPKHARPRCRDIPPFDYTPEWNLEAAEQLQLPRKNSFSHTNLKP